MRSDLQEMNGLVELSKYLMKKYNITDLKKLNMREIQSDLDKISPLIQ